MIYDLLCNSKCEFIALFVISFFTHLAIDVQVP